jgi:hypothetical protein
MSLIQRQCSNALAIDDQGDIVGYGSTAGGQTHGFVLTAVPEPSIFALAALGGALLLLRRATKGHKGVNENVISSLADHHALPPVQPGGTRGLGENMTISLTERAGILGTTVPTPSRIAAVVPARCARRGIGG